MMQFEISKRFNAEEQPESPEIEPGEEWLKIAVSQLAYGGGRVSFKFHVSYMFTLALFNRYKEVEEGIVLVVNDVNQQDCFSANFTSPAYVPSPGYSMTANLKSKPPLTFPPPSPEEMNDLIGGWVNGEVSFATPAPRFHPSVYLYVVLENYFSNVVALDLLNKEAIYYPPLHEEGP
jgi:hypothetical protein